MAINRTTTKLKGVGRGPVQAAGGIVVRSGREPQIAIVQMRKLGHWVLPKGKLDRGEDALTAARREVLEETGHQVSVHEYLGTLSYEVRRGPKVVQFWRMQTTGGPVRKLMRDIKAVRWLPLAEAIEALTHPREQAFLAQVGPAALQASAQSVRKKVAEPSATADEPKPAEQPPSAASTPVAPPAQIDEPQVDAPRVDTPRTDNPQVDEPPTGAAVDTAPPRKGLMEKIRAWVHVKAE